MLLFAVMMLLAACAPGKDFKYGIEQLNIINSKYGTTMSTYPDTTGKMDLMIGELSNLKNLNLNSGQQPLNYIVDYRILDLEAEKLYSESQKFGNAGTTKSGFSCKPRPLVLESASLRNQAALKAFEAVDVLRKLIREYPEDASSINLSEKNALFLNATFYQIEKDAKNDISVINRFCPENATLGFYMQEFKSKKLMSDEEISRLTYKDAVVIWKEERGFE